MMRKTPANKGIQEEMTVGELALMMTNSFNVVFEKFRSIEQDIHEIKTDVADLKRDVKSLTQKTKLLSESMVTKFEFQSLSLRVDKIDETHSL